MRGMHVCKTSLVLSVLDGGGHGYLALEEGCAGFVASFMDSQDGVCVGERNYCIQVCLSFIQETP